MGAKKIKFVALNTSLQLVFKVTKKKKKKNKKQKNKKGLRSLSLSITYCTLVLTTFKVAYVSTTLSPLNCV